MLFRSTLGIRSSGTESNASKFQKNKKQKKQKTENKMPEGADQHSDGVGDGQQENHQQQQQQQELSTGAFAFVDGSRYEGEYLVGVGEGPPVRHGEGKYTNGAEEYTGQWKNDKMCGKGKYVFASGAVYEGSFDDNKFHGQGRYTWPNSEREVC